MFLSLQPHVRGKSFCAAAIVLAAISFTNESVASPLAVGAVDRVDLKTSSVVVLGQQFQVGAGTLVTTEASYPRPVSLADVPQNALVWVEGEEKTSGAVSVDAVIVLPESYVPGASQLLLKGVVSSVSSDGQIRVGNLKVATTPTLELSLPRKACYSRRALSTPTVWAEPVERSPELAARVTWRWA
jgi:hypothetical protein